MIPDDAEKFQAHTDPSGDVRYAIAGTLATRPIQRADTRDSDQDGFPDRQEFQGIPTSVDGNFTRITTDPLSPDTDGDQLHESVEFRSMTTVGRDVGATSVQRDQFPIISDPTEIDSDDDQLSDLEERTIGTDPMSDDTDGDGLTDAYDERPTIDDTPPTVKFILTTRREGRLKIVDDSKVTEDTIEANPYYEGLGWRPSRSTVAWAQQGDQERPEYPDYYGYDFEPISGGFLGFADQYPDRHWVNVTDQNGTSARYLINHRKAGPSRVSKTAYSLGRQLISLPDLQSKPISSTAGVLLISTGYILENRLVVDISRPGADESGEFSVPLSEVVRRYNGTEFGNLVLPRGEYSESNAIETGRGWEFIDATDDDVTLDDIGRALEPDNAIGVTLPESDDSGVKPNVGIGITGPVDDPELVFVVVVGDTILRATAQDLEGIDSRDELDAAREFLHDDASETTKRVMTDGGLEDDDYASALVEAESDPSVSESDVEAARRTIEALNQEETAWDVVEETPAPAVEFFAEMESNNVAALLGQAQSAQQVADFLEATDGDAAELVQQIDDRGLYSVLLELESENQRGVANIAIHGKLDGRSQYIDRVDADSLIEIAQNYESGEYDSQDVPGTSNFLDLVVVAESPAEDGKPVFIDADDITHAIDRHVNGDDMKNRATTTFFPVGGRIDKTGAPEVQLPDRMPSEAGNINRTRLKKIAYEAIRNGKQDTIGDSVRYSLDRYGIQEVVINIEFRGHGQSIYPSHGDSVRRWSERAGGEWQRWDGNKWVTWSSYSP
ncbi:hypothetical protein [Halosimplex halobium]|uniref:hypothetical protein n=1 Tax=Halosimplex halobium TaxID=3396618 RepID=UPI003F56B32F